MKLNLDVFTSFNDDSKNPKKKLFSFLGKYKHEILILDQENRLKIVNILNGKQVKIPKILDQHTQNISIANIDEADENVVFLLKTGEVIIWNRETDLIHSIGEVHPNIVTSLITSIFISPEIKFISLVNNSNELFLWINDTPVYHNPSKSTKFNGKWIKFELNYQFSNDLSAMLSRDAIFIDKSIWGEIYLNTFILPSNNNQINVYSVKIDLKSLNTELNHQIIDGISESVDDQISICKFSKTEPILVVGINSKLIFINPLTGSKYLLDFPQNCRFLIDFCWICDDSLLICVFDDGKIGITTRFGNWIEINKSRDEIYTTRIFPITENNVHRSNFQILSHNALPIFIFCDSFSFSGLKITPEISNAIDLIEMTLKNQPKVKKRMKMKKKLNFKFKTKQTETLFDKNDDEITRILQRFPLISNLNLRDLICCFGLLNWNFQIWDEKMEILTEHTTWKIIENFQSISIGRDYENGVQIIEDNLLKCLNILQFDVNHRLLGPSMKLVIGVIDYLISIKDEIPVSQRVNFVRRVTSLLRKSQLVINTCYWLIEKVFYSEVQGSQSYFNYRLKRKWKDLYKLTCDLFFKYRAREIENYVENEKLAGGKSMGNYLKGGKEFEHEEKQKLMEAISSIQIELQSVNHRFTKRKKNHLNPGVKKYLSGKRDSGISTWINEINYSLRSSEILETSLKTRKKLSKNLRSVLYALIRQKKYSTLELFCRKLVVNVSSSSLQLQKEVCKFFVTLSRISALALLGKPIQIPFPHKPRDLCSLLINNPDLKFDDHDDEKLLNCESILLILVLSGSLNEATWFSYAIGDWKMALILSNVCEKSLEMKKRKSDLVSLPNYVSVDELLKNRIIGYLKVESKTTISNDRLIACLNDQVTVGILLDLKFDLGEYAVGFVIDELTKLMNGFSLLIDEQFYLPAPPIFCPQDEIVGSSECARIESQIRVDFCNLIDRLICVLISTNTLVALSFNYAKQFEDASLRSEFNRYNFENTKNHQTNLPNTLVQKFKSFCDLVWILHCRDQLNISWRTLWKNIDSTHKIEKLVTPCLTWAKNLIDMKELTKYWEEDLNSIILTLVYESKANKRIIDLFVDCFPPGWIIPSEFDFKWKLISDYWKRTKSENSDLFSYYTEKMKNRENDEKSDRLVRHESKTQMDFLIILFDIVVHKKIEGHKNFGEKVPLVKSNTEIIEKEELESITYLIDKLNLENIPNKIGFLPRWKSENFNENLWLCSKEKKGKSRLENYENVKNVENNEIEWKFQNGVKFNVESSLIPVLLWLDKWRERNNFDGEVGKRQMKIEFKMENLISVLSKTNEEENKQDLQPVKLVSEIEMHNVEEIIDSEVTQSKIEIEIEISESKPDEISEKNAHEDLETNEKVEEVVDNIENIENIDLNFNEDTISSISSLETERSPTPSLIIPKFLRLSAEKETDHPKHFPLQTEPKSVDDPRLRGGGPRPLPLLHIPRESIPVPRNVPSFHNAPPHVGLPLLRLPQKFLQWQRPRVDPCHVCVEDKICPPNVYVQNLLKNYWNHVREARCQQLVDDSLEIDRRNQVNFWNHFTDGNEGLEVKKYDSPSREVSKKEKVIRKSEKRVSKKQNPIPGNIILDKRSRKIVDRCPSPLSGSSSPVSRSPIPKYRTKSPPLKLISDKSTSGTKNQVPRCRSPVTRSTSPLSRNPPMRLLTEKSKSRTENKVPLVSRCTSPLFSSSTPISRTPSPLPRTPSPALRTVSPVSRKYTPPLKSRTVDCKNEKLLKSTSSPPYKSVKPLSRSPSPSPRSRSPISKKYNPFFESLQVVSKCPSPPESRKRNPTFVSEQLLPRSRSPSPVSRRIIPGTKNEKPVTTQSSSNSRTGGKNLSTAKKPWLGVGTSTYPSDTNAHNYPSSSGVVGRCVDENVDVEDFGNEEVQYPTDSNWLTADISASHFSIVSQLDRVKSILKDLNKHKTENKKIQTSVAKCPESQSEMEIENGYVDVSTAGENLCEDEMYGKKFQDWKSKCNSTRRRQIPALPDSFPDTTSLKVKSCFSGKSTLPPEIYRTREDLSDIFLYGKIPMKPVQKKWKVDENCLKNRETELENGEQPEISGNFGEINDGKMETVDKVVECTSFGTVSSSWRSLDENGAKNSSRSGILKKRSDMAKIPENVLSEGEEDEENERVILSHRETSGADKIPPTFLDFQINSQSPTQNFLQSPFRDWRRNIFPMSTHQNVVSPLSSPKIPARKLATNQLKTKLENVSNQLELMENISSQLEKGFKNSQRQLFNLVDENGVGVNSSPELSSPTKKPDNLSPYLLTEDLKTQRKSSSPSFNSNTVKPQSERDLTRSVNFKKRIGQACELMTELLLSQSISSESQHKFKPQVLNILTETRENIVKELNHVEITSEESTPKLVEETRPNSGVIKMSLGKEIKVDSTILEGSEDNNNNIHNHNSNVTNRVTKRQNLVCNSTTKKRLKVKMTRAAKLRRELAMSKLNKPKRVINKNQKMASTSQVESPKSKNSTPSGPSDWEIPSEIYNILY